MAVWGPTRLQDQLCRTWGSPCPRLRLSRSLCGSNNFYIPEYSLQSYGQFCCLTKGHGSHIRTLAGALMYFYIKSHVLCSSLIWPLGRFHVSFPENTVLDVELLGPRHIQLHTSLLGSCVWVVGPIEHDSNYKSSEKPRMRRSTSNDG